MTTSIEVLPARRLRIRPPAVADRAVPWIAPAIIAGAALLIFWSRLILMGQGFWGDEVRAIHFWGSGPGAIWDSARYIPGDHVLFQLLSWATNGILGSHAEAIQRLWSVVPAIAAGGLMVWWIWRRFDRWTAAVFAVLAAANPVYYELAPQARGYGLGFLAAALVLIGADGMVHSQSRRWTVLFSLGGFVGIATVVNFVGFFLGAAVVLVAFPRCRRQTIIAVFVVGVASLLWYAPLLSGMLGYSAAHGRFLAWDGFVGAPIRDLVGAEVGVLIPGVPTSPIAVFGAGAPASAGAIVAAVVIVVAVGVLWREGRASMALLLAVPVLATYLVITFTTPYAQRFGSFAVVPMLTLVAIGLVGPGRLLARAWRPAAVAMLVVLAVASVLSLGRFAHWSVRYASVPLDSARTAAQIITSTAGRPIPIYANGHPGAPFLYYVKREHVASPSTPAQRAVLSTVFCRSRFRLVYLVDPTLPAPGTACLIRRHATEIVLHQRLSPGSLAVWIVPAGGVVPAVAGVASPH